MSSYTSQDGFATRDVMALKTYLLNIPIVLWKKKENFLTSILSLVILNLFEAVPLLC